MKLAAYQSLTREERQWLIAWIVVPYLSLDEASLAFLSDERVEKNLITMEIMNADKIYLHEELVRSIIKKLREHYPV